MEGSLPSFSVHAILQQEYQSGLPCPPPGDLPNPWIEPALTSALASGFFLPLAPPGKPIRSVSRFFYFFLSCRCPAVPAPFVEKTTFFSTILPLLLCQRSTDCIYVGLFVDSVFCSTDLFVYFHQYHYLPFYSFKSSWSWIAGFVFLFKYCFGYSVYFSPLYKLYNHFLISAK